MSVDGVSAVTAEAGSGVSKFGMIATKLSLARRGVRPEHRLEGERGAVAGGIVTSVTRRGAVGFVTS